MRVDLQTLSVSRRDCLVDLVQKSRALDQKDLNQLNQQSLTPLHGVEYFVPVNQATRFASCFLTIRLVVCHDRYYRFPRHP